MPAVVALAAGGRVERDYAVAGLESGHAFPNLMYSPCEFMSEWNWRFEHAGVVAASIHLKVSSAGECGVYPHHNLPAAGFRHRNLLNAQILAAVEHGGCHVRCHLYHCLKAGGFTDE